MSLYPAFQRSYTPEAAGEAVRWLPLRDGQVFVQNSGEQITLISDSEAVRERFAACATFPLGMLDGTPYRTCDVAAETEIPEDWHPINLRNLYGQISETEWLIAGYAAQVLHWQKTSGFCPVCGGEMGPMQKEWMRVCTVCGESRYPPVSPAVLILVHDGADGILLAHKPGWGDRYSILAGFVLPGESLEECVHRETREEVGVRLTDLVYQGSQPWPFPHQLMIGFTARYAGGDIRLDEEELDIAAWFDVHSLPSLPPPLSLSRQMIDKWQQSRTLIAAVGS